MNGGQVEVVVAEVGLVDLGGADMAGRSGRRNDRARFPWPSSVVAGLGFGKPRLQPVDVLEQVVVDRLATSDRE